MSQAGVIPRLRDLPLSWRLTLTVFVLLIGVGYLFGVANIYERHRLADDKPEMTFDDLLITYHGKEVPLAEGESASGAPSKMLEQVRPGGEMRKHLEKGGQAAVRSLIDWLEHGAKEESFGQAPSDNPEGPSPEKVISSHCLRCHNADGGEKADTPYGPDIFTVDYALVRLVAEPPPPDPAATKAAPKTKRVGPASFSHMVQVTHAHIMSIPVFALLIFLLFQGSDMPQRWKALLGPLPMLGLVLDFSGWWLARSNPVFIHLLSLAGAIFGGVLAIQILAILAGLWVCRPAPRA